MKIIMFLTAALLSQYDIEVFYSSEFTGPVQRISLGNVSYYDMDEPNRLTEELNRRLSPLTEENVGRKYSEFQNSPAGKLYIEAMSAAYEGTARASFLQLEYHPAVVFNGSSVVYGTTDIYRALKEISHAN